MQRGWSLTETLVTLVIIGLLATIALPIFRGERANASNTQAQSNLQNAYRNAVSLKSDTWPAAATLVTQMRQNEAAFTYHTSTTSATGPNDISVQVDDANMVTFCTQSKTRLFYCMRTDNLNQIDTDVAVAPSGGFQLIPSATAAEDTTNGTSDAAHSTGATETAAKQALPTRNSNGTLTNNNARGWENCVGSCAVSAQSGQ